MLWIRLASDFSSSLTLGKSDNNRVRYLFNVMKASAVSTIGKNISALKCGSNRNVSVTENDERTVSLIKEVRDCVINKDVEIECLSQAESLDLLTYLCESNLFQFFFFFTYTSQCAMYLTVYNKDVIYKTTVHPGNF